MKFVPKSPEELQREGLLEKGIYDFEILEAQDTKSKKGSDMIKMKLNVFGPDGRGNHVFEYLVGIDSMMWKLHHFAESVGLGDKYADGTIEAEDCISRAGKCEIIIQEDEKGEFPPKNSVKDYIVPQAASPGERTATEEDDDIPF